MNDTALPAGFRFSQSSLSDYQRCRRRFWLRYVERMQWPGPPAADAAWEEAARRGQRFHQFIEQDALQLEVDAAVAASADPLLQEWWRNWRQVPPPGCSDGKVHTEVELAVPLGAYRLVARFDRVVVDTGGQVRIYDWKTGNADLAVYADSWQTRVYLYVVATAGGVLSGGVPPAPESIQLCYWHAAQPDNPLLIPYDRASHAAAERDLLAAANTIAADPNRLQPTDDTALCSRCAYCSYCQRQAVPEAVWDLDDENWQWILGEEEDEDGTVA